MPSNDWLCSDGRKLRSTRIKEGMRKAKEKGKKFGTDNLNVYWKQLEKLIKRANTYSAKAIERTVRTVSRCKR